jgi:hypothetical protein
MSFFHSSQSRSLGCPSCDSVLQSATVSGAGASSSGDQLHAAQDTQRVFGKPIRGMAQHAGGEVGPAVEWIAEFQGVGVPGHRVDREIAPAQCLINVHLRVCLTEQARYGLMVGRKTGGEGNVDGQSLQLEHAEGLAHELHSKLSFEQGMEWSGRQPEDFEIQILRLPAHDEVADRSADHPRPSACLANRLLDSA